MGGGPGPWGFTLRMASFPFPVSCRSPLARQLYFAVRMGRAVLQEDCSRREARPLRCRHRGDFRGHAPGTSGPRRLRPLGVEFSGDGPARLALAPVVQEESGLAN